MSLKILGKGFIWNKNSYLRNGWNILDFFIIVTGVLNYILSAEKDLKFSVLRIFRVLRPLKTISALKNLKKIISTLINALPMILNEIYIILFFLTIYAIAGVQLLSGVLKKRCFESTTGLMTMQSIDNTYKGILCGFDQCPSDDICGKLLENPNMGLTNFDSFLWSLLMMFQGITLENWSINMYYCVRAFSYYIVFFFISLAFLGAYVLMNLLVSIITKAYQEADNKTEKILKKDVISLKEMQVLKIYEEENYRKISRILNLQEINESINIKNNGFVQKIGFLQRILKGFKEIFLGKFSLYKFFKRKNAQTKPKKELLKMESMKDVSKRENNRKSFLVTQIQKLMDTDGKKKEKNPIKNLSHFGMTKSKNNPLEKENLKISAKLEERKNESFVEVFEEKCTKKNKAKRSLKKKINFQKNLLLGKNPESFERRKISRILNQMLDYKIMVDHSQEYVSTSTKDIISYSQERKKIEKEQKFYEEIKKTRYITEYKLYRILKNRKKKGFILSFRIALRKKKAFLMNNLNFYPDEGKNDGSSGCNSPKKNRKKKVEFKEDSFKVTYDYFRLKLKEEAHAEMLNEEKGKLIEEERKINFEHDFFEIKVKFFLVKGN